MDKLSEPITFKVSPRIKIDLQEQAVEEGCINVSELCRKWVIRALYNSKFRMKDYLNTLDEDQAK